MFDDFLAMKAFCELHAAEYLAFLKSIIERTK